MENISTSKVEACCRQLEDTINFLVHHIQRLPKEMQTQCYREDMPFILANFRRVLKETREGVCNPLQRNCLQLCIVSIQAYCSRLLLPSNFRSDIKSLLGELEKIHKLSEEQKINSLARTLNLFISQLRRHYQNGLQADSLAPLNAIGA